VNANAYKACAWLRDAVPLPYEEIRMLHQNVITRLKSGGQYGGWDAMVYMLGVKAATILAEKNFVIKRTTSASVYEELEAPRATSSQNMLETLHDLDDLYDASDDEELASRTAKRPRKSYNPSYYN
jgi:hypothetical protein